MRNYGRTVDANGNPNGWVEVDTDANGYNDYVYLLNLCQVILLNRGESPFWANYGIPAQQAVRQQVFPDFYMYETQKQFAGYFAALTITKLNSSTPTYRINVTTNAGVQASAQVQLPQ